MYRLIEDTKLKELIEAAATNNVVKLRTDKSIAIEDLKRLIAAMEAGEVEAVALVIDNGNGNIETGWYNAPPVKRQELVSHMQIDIIMGVVFENLERAGL